MGIDETTFDFLLFVLFGLLSELLNLFARCLSEGDGISNGLARFVEVVETELKG